MNGKFFLNAACGYAASFHRAAGIKNFEIRI
jgi:hypothetical protein